MVKFILKVLLLVMVIIGTELLLAVDAKAATESSYRDAWCAAHGGAVEGTGNAYSVR